MKKLKFIPISLILIFNANNLLAECLISEDFDEESSIFNDIESDLDVSSLTNEESLNINIEQIITSEENEDNYLSGDNFEKLEDDFVDGAAEITEDFKDLGALEEAESVTSVIEGLSSELFSPVGLVVGCAVSIPGIIATAKDPKATILDKVSTGLGCIPILGGILMVADNISYNLHIDHVRGKVDNKIHNLEKNYDIDFSDTKLALLEKKKDDIAVNTLIYLDTYVDKYSNILTSENGLSDFDIVSKLSNKHDDDLELRISQANEELKEYFYLVNPSISDFVDNLKYINPITNTSEATEQVAGKDYSYIKSDYINNNTKQVCESFEIQGSPSYNKAVDECIHLLLSDLFQNLSVSSGYDPNHSDLTRQLKAHLVTNTILVYSDYKTILQTSASTSSIVNVINEEYRGLNSNFKSLEDGVASIFKSEYETENNLNEHGQDLDSECWYYVPPGPANIDEGYWPDPDDTGQWYYQCDTFVYDRTNDPNYKKLMSPLEDKKETVDNLVNKIIQSSNDALENVKNKAHLLDIYHKNNNDAFSFIEQDFDDFVDGISSASGYGDIDLFVSNINRVIISMYSYKTNYMHIDLIHSIADEISTLVKQIKIIYSLDRVQEVNKDTNDNIEYSKLDLRKENIYKLYDSDKDEIQFYRFMGKSDDGVLYPISPKQDNISWDFLASTGGNLKPKLWSDVGLTDSIQWGEIYSNGYAYYRLNPTSENETFMYVVQKSHISENIPDGISYDNLRWTYMGKSYILQLPSISYIKNFALTSRDTGGWLPDFIDYEGVKVPNTKYKNIVSELILQGGVLEEGLSSRYRNYYRGFSRHGTNKVVYINENSSHGIYDSYYAPNNILSNSTYMYGDDNFGDKYQYLSFPIDSNIDDRYIRFVYENDRITGIVLGSKDRNSLIIPEGSQWVGKYDGNQNTHTVLIKEIKFIKVHYGKKEVTLLNDTKGTFVHSMEFGNINDYVVTLGDSDNLMSYPPVIDINCPISGVQILYNEENQVISKLGFVTNCVEDKSDIKGLELDENILGNEELIDISTTGNATASSNAWVYKDENGFAYYPDLHQEVFDDDHYTYWRPINRGDEWIGQDFGSGNEQKIKGYSIKIRDVGYHPIKWELQVRNSEDDFWDTLHTVVDENYNEHYESKTYYINNENSYRYVRLYFPDTNSYYSIIITEIEFLAPISEVNEVNEVDGVDGVDENDNKADVNRIYHENEHAEAVVPEHSGYYALRLSKGGYAMSPTGNLGEGARIVQLSNPLSVGTGDTDVWKFIKIDSVYFYLENKHSKLYLGVEDGFSGSSNLILKQFNVNDDSIVWSKKPVGDNHYSLVNKRTEMCAGLWQGGYWAGDPNYKGMGLVEYACSSYHGAQTIYFHDVTEEER